MRKVLVTGVTGFAGSHLVDYMLTRNDVEIYGIQRWRSRTENIEHFADRIRLLECDLRDADSTRDTIAKIRPDWIFHLAAQSFVPTSWRAPSESLTTNVLGQLNLFEACRRIATADSITTATQGTGAPGWETWRQWGDRLAVAASDSARAANPALARDSSLALRAVAYARTRAALAAGPTSIGYGLASAARKALEHAQRASGGEGEAFLAHLGSEVDRVFVPGSTPPPAPKAAPKKKSRTKRGR